MEVPLRRLRIVLAAAALACATAGGVGAQFSPGPLSRFHRDLEGTGSCTRCHELGVGKGPTDARCLDCHQALAARVTSGRGFHARGGRNQGCTRCHSEHNGRDYDLVGLDKARFDHGETGYPLEGKHAGLACERCHKTGPGYLGLAAACGSCHEDVHRGQLGAECRSCHDESAWKPASRFDHAKTSYPLTGEHLRVDCAKCHPQGRYAGVPFDGCDACHASPHTPSFSGGKPCSGCHATAGWASGSAAGFDHARTPFPLEGAHARVACAACHKGGRFRGIGAAGCPGCHADPHQGQFAAGRPAGCTSCHDVNAWKPAARFDHAATRYPLVGKHAAARCDGCHPGGRFVGTATACNACHADAHRGTLGQDCGICHAPEAWAAVSFHHENTRFPLAGRHQDARCASCHGSGAPAVYKDLDRTCGACHADVHREQFAERYPAAAPPEGTIPPRPASAADSAAFAIRGAARPAAATDCASCHSPAGWRPTSYDHRKSRFPLEGAHEHVACALCHKDGVFAGAPLACVSCHPDPHEGQFARQSCADCHAPTRWTEVRFDHRGTAFPLTGRHAEAACSACHAQGIFQGLSTQCADCHDDAHLRALGLACGRCHTSDAWVPSTFQHGIEIFPEWGAHQAVDCAACHRDEVTWQVGVPPRECMDCHDQDFRRAPVVVHAQAGPDCERCHSLDSWSPAHDDAWFDIRSGRHRGVPCSTCHDLAPDYPDYTCNPCHQGHDDGRRRCLECHPHGFGRD